MITEFMMKDSLLQFFLSLLKPFSGEAASRQGNGYFTDSSRKPAQRTGEMRKNKCVY